MVFVVWVRVLFDGSRQILMPAQDAVNEDVEHIWLHQAMVPNKFGTPGFGNSQCGWNTTPPTMNW
jgi:hypothetical protein